MKLRNYQEAAINSVFNYFYAGKTGNPVVALPTGTGKSVVIADLIRSAMQSWPDQRFLMLTHVKELIEQNADKFNSIWPTAPIGIYSAGLGEKNSYAPIVFGGIASVNSDIKAFGHRDIVIVDECHTISNKASSMYQKVITGLKEINPLLKVIGFTATPYRMGQGMITDDGLFTDICFDLTNMQGFNNLLAEGYIAPLIPKRTSIELNTESVKITAGEFNNHELQQAVDIDAVTYSAVRELLEYGHQRNCGLIFATGIEHCEHIAAAIQSFGETATFVHSKMSNSQRDENLIKFKQGVYKYVISNGVLTTGFDHPPIDIMGILRPTMSVGLWVQMLGRGTRPYDCTNKNQYIPGFEYRKENCLVLDFAKNTPRLGPINDPVKPRKKGQKTGEAPIRICSNCGVYNHASARKCYICGHEFPLSSKLMSEAGTAELIKSDLPIIETFNVSKIIYYKHFKTGSRAMIRATYYSGLRRFDEYVCLEHPGFAGRRALEWWQQRTSMPMPSTTEEALAIIANLRKPIRIRVHTNKKFPEILAYEY